MDTEQLHCMVCLLMPQLLLVPVYIAWCKKIAQSYYTAPPLLGVKLVTFDCKSNT